MSNTYLLQVVVCVVFLGLLFLIAKVLAKKSRFNNPSNGELRILEKLQIGQKEKILLMSVENEKILVGVTANQISLIKNMDDKKSNETKN